MKVIDYIIEEVERQGHDTRVVSDGLVRVGFMTKAWVHAYLRRDPLDINFIIELGKLIEPGLNQEGLRTVQVQVGVRLCPNPSEIRPMLEQLIEQNPNLEPLDFYRQFEEIHPFRDGNGRTGKILLNWLNNSMNDPIFPPKDFWGQPIRNP